MRRRHSFSSKLLALLLTLGILSPQPCRGEIVLPPLHPGLVEASKAFMVILGPELVVISGAVVVGVAAYNYYSAAPKLAEETQPVPKARPDLKLVPPPSPNRNRGKKDDPTLILKLLSPYVIAKAFRDQKTTGELTTDPERPKQETTEDPSRLDEKIRDSGKSPATGGIGIPDSMLEPPPSIAEDIVTSINLVGPGIIKRLIDSRDLEYKYDPSRRYNPSTKWGAYDPDDIRTWAKTKGESTKATEESIQETKRAITRALQEGPKFSAKAALERLENPDLRPSGYSNEVVSRELDEIRALHETHNYHHAAEKLREFLDDIQIYRQIPNRKDLVEYWEQQLRKNFISDTGILKGLGAREIPELKGALLKPGGPRLVANINHVLIAKKTLEAAWSFYAPQDGLTNLKDPQVRKQIEKIANGIEIFDILTDKAIGDLIDAAHSTQTDQDKATEFVNDIIEFGQDLQKGDGPLVEKIEKWNREKIEEVFPWLKGQPAAAPDTIPTELEEYRNWRILEESVRAEKVLNEQNWARGSAESESIKEENRDPSPDTNSPPAPGEASTDAPAKSDPENAPQTRVDEKETPTAVATKKIPLSKIREVLGTLRKQLGGKGLRNQYNDLFELIGIELSDDVNRKAVELGLQPPHKENSVIAILKTKEPTLLARLHRFDLFKLQNDVFYAPAASMMDKSGKPLTINKLISKFSIPEPTPSRIALVETGSGHIFRVSLTSQIFEGLGGVIQYQIENIDKNNARIISDAPLQDK